MTHESPLGQPEYPILPETPADKEARVEQAVAQFTQATQENAQLTAENATLRARVDHLQTIAYTDELTGLGNRHAFNEAYEEAVNSGDDVGIIMFDIKNFGLVNKRRDHVFGDNVLKYVGQSFLTADFLVTRHGGDEFIALIRVPKKQKEAIPYPLHNTSEETWDIAEVLPAVAERLSSGFKNLPVVKKANEGVSRSEQLGLRSGYAVAQPGAARAHTLAQADPRKRTEDYFDNQFTQQIPGWRLAHRSIDFVRISGGKVLDIFNSVRNTTQDDESAE